MDDAATLTPEKIQTEIGRDLYQEYADHHGLTREDAKVELLKRAYGMTGPTAFTQVAEFHRKFGLPGLDQEGPPHDLDDEAALFRINFMCEELAEYAECSGFRMVAEHLKYLCLEITKRNQPMVERLPEDPKRGGYDLHGQLDALVDLSYVLHGTALFHAFRRFDDAFSTVHVSNMGKVRATSEEQSKRGTKLDVVKPRGWAPPVLDEFLR